MGFSFDIENWIYNNINKIEEEINDGYLMNLLGNKNISNLKIFEHELIQIEFGNCILLRNT